jgi:hypothetical protein
MNHLLLYRLAAVPLLLCGALCQAQTLADLRNTMAISLLILGILMGMALRIVILTL